MEQRLLSLMLRGVLAAGTLLACTAPAARPQPATAATETAPAGAPEPSVENPPQPSPTAPLADKDGAAPAHAAQPGDASKRGDAAERDHAGAAPGQAKEALAALASETASSPTETAPPAAPELPRGTLVLHVGDSFAGALGVPLAKRLRAHGLRSVLEYQTSSYIPTWADGDELPHYIARYNPDLVLITLGANEFDIVNPEQRAHSVRRLVRHLGGRPCVWISPPRWKQDTGILAVIRDNAPPCRFLDSDTIVHDLERKSDHIHPSAAGREVWADAVLDWLARARRPDGERPWDLNPAP